ncbi:TPA: energy coupling factor transporter S component ThiW [Candidatus Geothermarchaeota archaeon]|nr:energy coupling factor transporter S component ThiW [Candidatus Geothermarchaeota archaeon]HIQ13823.1 energy coupling factor transporter S component ThiW [Thermoprotei archaeon]
MRISVKIALIASYTALGIVLSPLWFPVLGSKAFPFQHMINILSAITLGPLYAALVAVFVGIIRYSLGLGTIYAFPGGIPGGLVVGTFYILLRRYIPPSKAWKISAFTEPIGTVLIGALTSYFLIAPLIGDERTLALASENIFTGLLIFSTGWFISSFIGVLVAFTTLYFLEVSRYIRFLEG